MILTAKTLELLMIAGGGRQFKVVRHVKRNQWMGLI